MRYFFNIAGDTPIDDPEGMELADLAVAHQHAIAIAHGLMRRTRIFRHDHTRWQVQITDETGAELLVVPFDEAAAKMPAQPADRAGFAGKLGWRVQLHLGRHVDAMYKGIVDADIPDRLAQLLRRLSDKTGSKHSG